MEKGTTTFFGRNSQFTPTFTNRKLFFIFSQSPAVILAISLKLAWMETQNKISKRIFKNNNPLYVP